MVTKRKASTKTFKKAGFTKISSKYLVKKANGTKAKKQNTKRK